MNPSLNPSLNLAPNPSPIIDLVTLIESTRHISYEDVRALRRCVFADERVWPHEAEALFSLARKRLPSCDDWQPFFIEALTDFVVRQAEPEGYVSEDNAQWLIAAISRDGAVWSDTELELLVQVLDKAMSGPPSLVAFALSKVKEGVLTGSGPTRKGMALKPGSIGAAEVDLLRRILYAFGGSGNIAITREEAEVLFDINDATLNGDNDPAWQDLFVRAVANHLMSLSGYSVPSRTSALARQAWLDDDDSSVSGFFGRMISGWRDTLAAYAEPEEGAATDEAASQIGEVDALWLKQRILNNGHVCPNQRALLEFIREEAPDVHPQLRELLGKAA
ncbi:MAG: hypothetical protein AB7F96_00630 [Beijerinckiaceae bacterium]